MAIQLHIVIDRASPVPLYHQLAEQLTAAVEDGTLQPGDPFENELALADRLDLSRPTVRRAIGELVARGLLVRRRGTGTTVANKAIHRRDELTSLYEDLQRVGRHPVTVVREFDGAARNPDAAEALGLTSDTELIYVQRVRNADGRPLTVMNNWLPPACSGLTRQVLERQGLYAALRDLGIRPAVARQSIGARRPTPEERKLLGVDRTDPVLTMQRTAYDGTGNPVEFGRHSYRSDHYSFDVTLHER